MKMVDLFLEIIISSLPGNQESEPMAFQLWMSSALADVTWFLNWSINRLKHISSQQRCYICKCTKHVISTRQQIECTRKGAITLFRTHGVNPETVLVRRENKPQRVVLQFFPWIAMGTTCNNNIPCPQVSLFNKTETDSHRHRDQTCGRHEAGKGWRGTLTLADANFNMQDEQTIRSYSRAQRTISSLLK